MNLFSAIWDLFMGPTSAQNPKQAHIYMEWLTCPSLPAAPCDAAHYAYDLDHPAIKKKVSRLIFFTIIHDSCMLTNTPDIPPLLLNEENGWETVTLFKYDERHKTQ